MGNFQTEGDQAPDQVDNRSFAISLPVGGEHRTALRLSWDRMHVALETRRARNGRQASVNRLGSSYG